MNSELVLAVFELLAEPPEEPDSLTLLFSIENRPDRKWLIFEAHRRWPRLFLKHIRQYSSGGITDEQYANWLGDSGLHITERGLRYRR